MYSATGQRDKLSTHPFVVFSLQEILSATKDFDEEQVIGQGAFGKVYKGHVYSKEGSYVVAIKRLDSMSTQGESEFRAEIETLSTLRHCHLVSLIGYCDENKEMILVYEYVSNGTLYHHLHKSKTPLSWVQRIKIAKGVSRGLDYLHTGVGTRHGIIHRDVKSSNILLDEKWEALISDFGLSKIGPTNQSLSYVDASVKGTFGYLDPEYFYTRRLTMKTDVFAFGVVLFELISGRLPVDMKYGEEQCSLVRWAQKCVKERKFDQLVDSNISGKIFPKCLRRFTQIAYDCLLSDPKERPTMTDVVSSLQALLELQQKQDIIYANSPGTMGFMWNIHKYLPLKTKQNSDERKGSSANKDDGYHGETLHQHGDLAARDLKIFTYDEMKCASRNFQKDTCLGKGTNGAVYKGWVDKMTYSPCKHGTGLPIAIKRFDSYNHYHPDTDTRLPKVIMSVRSYERFDPVRLNEFSHPNIVKLIGYCLEGEQLFLVHEFMSNGNLKDLLHSGAVKQLPLVTKVKIGVGIARAIVFLHKTDDPAGPSFYGVRNSLLHEQNILLDENFTPKLSDYDFPGGRTYKGFDINDYMFGDQPVEPACDLDGFRTVFEELVTGRDIYTIKQLYEIDIKWPALRRIAYQCFKMCNEVNVESKMLNILGEDYVE